MKSKTPGQSPEMTLAFRNYVLLRLGSSIAAALILVAIVLIFALKNTPAGFLGACVAAVVLFAVFQILFWRRHIWFKRWLALNKGSAEG